VFTKGWNINPIEISGTVLFEDNYKAVSKGFVRVIVYDKKTNEINLIKIVTINPYGNFTTGTINLNNNDEIRIGAYANDVNWDNIIINNNNQQSDANEIGAYANDINWDQWDNMIISNNNQQSDANEIGAYANDINWDQWDNMIINNNQQNDVVEIGAYANDITDNLITTKRIDEDTYNMVDVDLESDLDNIIICVERKDNKQDHGGTEFIGTYPRRPRLLQNYPNPFNPKTNIDYSISKNTFVSITVYDITGREVANLLNEFKTPGNYSVTFDGSNLTSGFYFYQIIAGDFHETKKMSLLK
jgi:hypothetical protein